jgi:hypothetical protein
MGRAAFVAAEAEEILVGLVGPEVHPPEPGGIQVQLG